MLETKIKKGFYETPNCEVININLAVNVCSYGAAGEPGGTGFGSDDIIPGGVF